MQEVQFIPLKIVNESWTAHLYGLVKKEINWIKNALTSTINPEAEIISEVLQSSDVTKSLRIAKGRIALWTALQDLSGNWQLEDVSKCLSEFAGMAKKPTTRLRARDGALAGEDSFDSEADISEMLSRSMSALKLGEAVAATAGTRSNLSVREGEERNAQLLELANTFGRAPSSVLLRQDEVTSTPKATPSEGLDSKLQHQAGQLFDAQQSIIPYGGEDQLYDFKQLYDTSQELDSADASVEITEQTQIHVDKSTAGVAAGADALDVEHWVNYGTTKLGFESLLIAIPSEHVKAELIQLVPERIDEAFQYIVQTCFEYAGKISQTPQYKNCGNEERIIQLDDVIKKIINCLHMPAWSHETQQGLYDQTYQTVMSEYGLYQPPPADDEAGKVLDDPGRTMAGTLTVTSLDTDLRVKDEEQEGIGLKSDPAQVIPKKSPACASPSQSKTASLKAKKDPGSSRTNKHNEKYDNPKPSGQPDATENQGAQVTRKSQLASLKQALETRFNRSHDVSRGSVGSSVLRVELEDQQALVKKLQNTVQRQDQLMKTSLTKLRDEATASLSRLERVILNQHTQHQNELAQLQQRSKEELEKEVRCREQWVTRAQKIETEYEKSTGAYENQLKSSLQEQQSLKVALQLQQAYDLEARLTNQQKGPVETGKGAAASGVPDKGLKTDGKGDSQPPIPNQEILPKKTFTYPVFGASLGARYDNKGESRNYVPPNVRYDERSATNRQPMGDNRGNPDANAHRRDDHNEDFPIKDNREEGDNKGNADGGVKKNTAPLPLLSEDETLLKELIETYRSQRVAKGQEIDVERQLDDQRTLQLQLTLGRTIERLKRLEVCTHTPETSPIKVKENQENLDPVDDLLSVDERDEMGDYVPTYDERIWKKRRLKMLNYKWSRIDQIPKFTGDKKSIPWEKWQQRFLSECKELKLDEDIRVRILGDKLNHGDAADTLCNVKDICAIIPGKKYTSDFIMEEFTAHYFDAAAKLRLKKEVSTRAQEGQSLYEYANDMYHLCRRLFAQDYQRAKIEWHDAMERGVGTRRDFSQYFKKAASDEPYDILAELRDLGEHLETPKHSGVSEITASTFYTGNLEPEMPCEQLNRIFCTEALSPDVPMDEKLLMVNFLQDSMSTWTELGRDLVPGSEVNPQTVMEVLLAAKPRNFRQAPEWIRDLKNAVSRIVTSKVLDAHKNHPIPMIAKWNTPECKAFRSWLLKHTHVILNALQLALDKLVTPDHPSGKPPQGEGNVEGKGPRQRYRKKKDDNSGGQGGDSNAQRGPPGRGRGGGGRGRGGPPGGAKDPPEVGGKMTCQMCGLQGATYGIRCAKDKVHLCANCCRSANYREMVNAKTRAGNYCVFCANGIDEPGKMDALLFSAMKDKHFPD